MKDEKYDEPPGIFYLLVAIILTPLTYWIAKTGQHYYIINEEIGVGIFCATIAGALTAVIITGLYLFYKDIKKYT